MLTPTLCDGNMSEKSPLLEIDESRSLVPALRQRIKLEKEPHSFVRKERLALQPDSSGMLRSPLALRIGS